MKTLVEIVCCTVDDAIAAEAGGADRIELCCALQVGGLTPSLGLLRAVKTNTTIPVMAMLRPRPSGFCCSATELDVMRSDARLLLDNGADGIVFGCLTDESDIDVEATRTFVEIAGDREAVFHRAFDLTSDYCCATEVLINCGVSRLLTSGQAPTAIAGAPIIKHLQTFFDGQIQILAGGGVRAHNVVDLVKQTGCSQVHLAPRMPRRDSGAFAAHGIDYGEDGRVTSEAVAEIVGALASAMT